VWRRLSSRVVFEHPRLTLVEDEVALPSGAVVSYLRIPGGGGRPDETPAAAANRELMEESGYRAGRLTELGWWYANNRRSDAKMHVFLAEELAEAGLPPDAEEAIENVWVTEDELERLIQRGDVVNAFLLAAWRGRAPRRPAGRR